ncbi:MAG: acyl-CoA dehydrogenase family protein [Janthinobacterium lividum]
MIDGGEREAERLERIRMTRDSAAAVAPRDGDLRRVRAQRHAAPGFDRAMWRQMAELGWIGLRLPEEAGGAGMGMAESVALYEELGAGLVPEPLVAASLAAAALAATPDPSLLADVLAGDVLVPLAWQGGRDAIGLSDGPAGVLHHVPMAGAADHLLLPVREGGRTRLLLLDPAEAEATPAWRQDGTVVATLRVSAGVGRVLAEDVGEALDRALDEATLGTAAYLLGVAERAFAITLDYLRQRRQFGQPLAAFQALQHRAADMKIQLTLTRASVEGAADELDAGATPVRRAAAVSRAKARAADTALLVGREAIQMHGAIGYADACDIGLFTRKAMALANEHGSAMAHRARFARLADELAA